MLRTFKKTNRLIILTMFGALALIANIFGDKNSSILFSGDNVPFGIEKADADVAGCIGGYDSGAGCSVGEGSCGGEGSGSCE